MLTGLVKLASQHSPVEKLEPPEEALERIYGSKRAGPGVPSGKLPVLEVPQEPEIIAIPEPTDIASACVPCALGHMSTSTGMLNEAIRFKKDGIASNEVLDRIAKTLEELNSLERVDLAPDKIEMLPPWEKTLANEALLKSREIRHKVEGIKAMNDLEKIAAETDRFYKKLNREWFKQRLSGKGITKGKLEEMKQTAAQQAADKVEKEVMSSE